VVRADRAARLVTYGNGVARLMTCGRGWDEQVKTMKMSQVELQDKILDSVSPVQTAPLSRKILGLASQSFHPQ